MTKEEFEKSLRIGLGSAILHLKSHDYTPHKDAILNACLHNIAYDPQIEGYKTNYIMEIIDLTQNVDFYREQILRAISEIDVVTDYRDARHLAELTSAFASQGDIEARQIIYDVFNANLEDEDTLGGRYIIETDGLDGFVYVASKFADMKQHDAEPRADDYYLWILEEMIGEEVAQNQLNKIRLSHKLLDFYLKLVEKSRRKPKKSPKVSTPPKSYVEFKATSTDDSFGLSYWGQTATKSDLELVGHDLVKENDPIKVASYLRLFQRIPFPLEPELLFRFMDMERPSWVLLPVMTLSALALIEHPSIRDFALDLINNDNYSGSAVRLLAQNYKEGDWELIESLSEKLKDSDEYHDFGRSVQDVFEKQPSPSATQTLQNIYYNNPCSFCRERIVAILHEIGGLNSAMLNECRYDSNQDIREWAEKITLD